MTIKRIFRTAQAFMLFMVSFQVPLSRGKVHRFRRQTHM
jgi:hypothetical protein